MKLLLIFFMSFVSSIILAGENNSQLTTQRLSTVPIDKRVLETEYFSLRVSAWKLPNLSQKQIKNSSIGAGSLVLINPTDVLHLSSDGISTLINIEHKEILSANFPRLDLGINGFHKTRHYTYIETSPRVLDALVYKNKLYVSHNYYDQGQDNIHFQISMIDLKKPSSWKVLYKSIPLDVSYFALGNGGAMAASDDSLYFSIGDQSLDRKNGKQSDFASQNPNQPWGKILRIKLNSFFDHKARVCSVGHRNPQGLVFSQTGELFSTEHGPRGGDEINKIICGKNYGWPNFSYGTGYTAYGLFAAFDRGRDYEDPVFYFTPSIGIGQVVSLGKSFKEWQDNLLVASLKAESLFRVKLSQSGNAQNVEQINLGHRVRDLVSIEDKILLVTDDGLLMEIFRDPGVQLLPSGFPELTKCTICHALEQKQTAHFGPNLSSVFNSIRGSSDYEYSADFSRSNKFKWDKGNLKFFLKNPNSVIPGTKMPQMNLTDSEIEGAVNALERLRTQSQL